MKPEDFALIAAVNDDAILQACLSRSPDVATGRLSLTTIRNANNMAQAYNQGLDQTSGRYAIFAHQDVYLPAGWLDKAIAALSNLEAVQPDWMVAGPYGVREDGTHAGCVWDVGMDTELGECGFAPTPVVSLDELLLIVRRDADYRFDADLPHFHLYGTDIVQTALSEGRSAWALDMPVVHNSQIVASLAGGYTKAHHYMRRKWRHRLPIPTTVTPLTHNPFRILKARWSMRGAPERDGTLLADAVKVAKRAGYE